MGSFVLVVYLFDHAQYLIVLFVCNMSLFCPFINYENHPWFLISQYIICMLYRYGQMERAILSSETAGVDLRGAVIRGVGAQGVELSETVRRMEESIPQVIVLLEAAVDRCISFTGGSEADELILALDDVMLQYISTLQETLKSLRTVCGVDNIGDGPSKRDLDKKDGNQNNRRVDLISNEEEWSIVQGALQILTVSDSLTSRASVFEASLRATLARLSTSLSLSVFGSSLDQNQVTNSTEDGLGGRAALDVASLRLVDLPEKAKKLFNLLNQVYIKLSLSAFAFLMPRSSIKRDIVRSSNQ